MISRASLLLLLAVTLSALPAAAQPGVSDTELVIGGSNSFSGPLAFTGDQITKFGVDLYVRVINDAAMQALGSYHGRRMLFLGLGTGLGSALVWKQNLLPLELGDLPYRDRQIIEEWLGIPGLQRLGETEWKEEVLYAVAQLKRSFIADYVVLGGGNAKRFQKLPEGVEPGENENAYRGGLRLWEDKPGSRQPKWHIL